MTTLLIETWLPIVSLGEESVRERRSMTALPPTYYLHPERPTQQGEVTRAERQSLFRCQCHSAFSPQYHPAA
ncbi:MAG: hypothetical protein HQL58_11465 [Magnetococcales bacterium]|nr:hypothetical protein [Magnetococcales bacterium]